MTAGLRPARSAPAFAAVCLATCLGAGAVAQSPPSLEQVLSRASLYVDAFIAEAGAIVAEEDYMQRASSAASSTTTRRLKSDMAIVFGGEAGWAAFRDVFEVDGQPVRDRDDRLARLFMAPGQDAMTHAQAIVAEGARFNVSPRGTQIARTINVPITALRFIEARNVDRSAFRLDWTTSQGRRVARLRFTERAEPRLIRSPDNATASGFILVDPDSGVVVETDLNIQTGAVHANLRTRYAPHPRFTSWLPVSMEETYTTFLVRSNIEQSRVDGRATYSNFRAFGISVGVETSPTE
jgi:hypothetical protein